MLSPNIRFTRWLLSGLKSVKRCFLAPVSSFEGGADQEVDIDLA